jgi:hypothetical protein
MEHVRQNVLALCQDGEFGRKVEYTIATVVLSYANSLELYRRTLLLVKSQNRLY